MNDKQKPPEKDSFINRNFSKILVVGIIILMGSISLNYMAFPEGEIVNELTIENKLTNTGWIMISSTSCPACAQQKTLFNNIDALTIHECDISQKNYERCLEMDIEAVPTWYNVNTNRSIIGVQSIEALEEMTK